MSTEKPPKDAREISRVHWKMPVSDNGTWPSGGAEVVNMGSLARIADALEKIAQRGEQERTDLRNARLTNRRLRTQIRNLKCKPRA